MQEQIPLVGLVMGSKSDWPTMRGAAQILDEFSILHQKAIISAHRTPERLFAYAESSMHNGLEVIIAGAGGAAHLPGMLAAKTVLPVIGVPVASKYLNGLDSLYSIVQMPKGIPVATLAIGEAGAVNAGLLAVRILSCKYSYLREKLIAYRTKLADDVYNDQEFDV